MRLNVVFIRRKKLKLLAVLMLIIGAAMLFFGIGIKTGDKSVSAKIEASITNSFDTTQKQVAISIETEFGEDYTEEIIEVLKKHRVKACFCVMGLWAEDNIDSLKLIKENKHNVISHSMYHEDYSEISNVEMLEDIKSAEECLKILLGIDTDKIRLPFQKENSQNDVAVDIKNSGRKVIGFSLDCRTIPKGNIDSFAMKILKKLQPGDILAFTNADENTAMLLDMMISALHENGYEIVDLNKII